MSETLLPVPWTAVQLEQITGLQQGEAVGFARRAELLVTMSAGCDDRESGWAGDVPLGSLLLEVAGSAVVHQNTVGGWLADAQHLVTRLPLTHAAMLTGTLHLPQARQVMKHTAHLDAQVCALVEQSVLPRLTGLMPSRVGQLVAAAVLTLDADAADASHALAMDTRDVQVTPAPAGMVELRAQTDAVSGMRFGADLDDLEDHSRHQQADATATGLREQGRRGHRRADLLADLPGLCAELLDRLDSSPNRAPLVDDELSLIERWFPQTANRLADTPAPASPGAPGSGGGADRDSADRDSAADPASPAGRPGRRPAKRRRPRRPRVQVRIDVPVTTCHLQSDQPGWLHGYGPISARHTIALLPTAELRRGLIDARTGQLLALDPLNTPPDLDQALDQALTALRADDRGRQQHQAQARTEQQQPWDGHDRRQHPRPDDPEAAAGADDSTRLLGSWIAQQPPPATLDPSTLTPDRRDLLALALADRVVPPEDPSRRVEPQHDPSRALVELVHHRDLSCDGIGCTVTAHRTDLDHHQRYDPTSDPSDPSSGAGTRTAAANLKARSERCHQAKHHPHWTVITHNDGTSTWTGPTGRSYPTSTSARPAPTDRKSVV